MKTVDTGIIRPTMFDVLTEAPSATSSADAVLKALAPDLKPLHDVYKEISKLVKMMYTQSDISPAAAGDMEDKFSDRLWGGIESALNTSAKGVDFQFFRDDVSDFIVGVIFGGYASAKIISADTFRKEFDNDVKKLNAKVHAVAKSISAAIKVKKKALPQILADLAAEKGKLKEKIERAKAQKARSKASAEKTTKSKASAGTKAKKSSASMLTKIKADTPRHEEELSQLARVAIQAFSSSPATVDWLDSWREVVNSREGDDRDRAYAEADKISGSPDVYDVEDVLQLSKLADRKFTASAIAERIRSTVKAKLDGASSGRVSSDDLTDFKQFLKHIPSFVSRIEKHVEKMAERLDAASEAPPAAPLGRIAFAGTRPNKPFEPDTDREKALHRALLNHIRNNIALSGRDVTDIKELLKKGWYSEVFKAPSVPVVYRGMAVSKKWLMAALKRQRIDEKGSVEKSFTYTPRRGGSSSWSTVKSVAKAFAIDSDARFTSSADVLVILSARVKDNAGSLITGPGGIYKVVDADFLEDEKEVVGLGKLRVFKVEWFDDNLRNDSY